MTPRADGITQLLFAPSELHKTGHMTTGHEFLWRQGMHSYDSTLYPVVICPDLCTSPHLGDLDEPEVGGPQEECRCYAATLQFTRLTDLHRALQRLTATRRASPRRAASCCAVLRDSAKPATPRRASPRRAIASRASAARHVSGPSTPLGTKHPGFGHWQLSDWLSYPCQF